MTLRAWQTRFWAHTGTDEARWPREAVTDLLNDGWRHVAEDIGGFGALRKSGTEAGVEEYELPDGTMDVLAIRITANAGATTVATPTRVDFSKIAVGADLVAASTPQVWAWGIRDYGTSGMRKILRLYPAYSETADEALWIEYKTLPQIVRDPACEPQVHDGLVTAGLWWACLAASTKATDKDGFSRLYNLAVARWNRNNPMMRGKRLARDFRIAGSQWNWLNKANV